MLSRYEAAGVDQVIFLAQAGRTKHEHICESLELFARDVMPEFVAARARAPGGEGSARGAAIEEAMSRKAPPRAVDPSYTFSAAGKL